MKKARLELVTDDADDAPELTEEPASGVRDVTDAPLVDSRYRVLRPIGMGGMGVVHHAEDVWLGRSLALKLLQPANHLDESALEDFKKEARVLARVRHENVVQVYAFGPHGKSFYLAMEYVAGKNLDDLIDAHGKLGGVVARDRALAIVRHVGRGLSAVHALGIVHRDVKPSNIVIEEETGRPVLIDFGMARRHLDATNPKLSMIAGTPAYMAPEQAMDASGASVTARSDLYALACTTFELLTGRSVFSDEDAYKVLAAHVQQAPPKPSSMRPELAPLDAVLLRALSKSPQDRQESCEQFVDELEAAAKKISRAPAPRARETLPEIATAGSGQTLHVVIWERDEGFRRQIERVARRALRATGDGVELSTVSTAEELTAHVARARVDIAIIDEQSTNHASDTAIRLLRTAEASANAEIIVLDREWDVADERVGSLRVCQLPKPVSQHVLSAVLTRLRARVSARPRGATEPAAT